MTMAVLAVASVAAHADLIDAVPAPGSTVSGSPATIRLSFSQPLQATSRIDLFAGQFQAVPGVSTLVAGSEMRAVLASPLAPATYTVQWTAFTDDGHSTAGSYQFGVAATSGTSGPLGGKLAPLVAGVATILSGGVAIFAWILNRRQRV